MENTQATPSSSSVGHPPLDSPVSFIMTKRLHGVRVLIAGKYLPVIQVAKISGFSPIITTASLRNADFLQSLGATHVIDRNLPLGDAVKSVTTEPIKYVYDAISTKHTQQPSYDVLAPGGKLIIVLHPALDKSKIDDSKTVVEAFGAVYDPAQRELGATVFKHFTSLLESGEIKVCLKPHLRVDSIELICAGIIY